MKKYKKAIIIHMITTISMIVFSCIAVSLIIIKKDIMAGIWLFLISQGVLLAQAATLMGLTQPQKKTGKNTSGLW